MKSYETIHRFPHDRMFACALRSTLDLRCNARFKGGEDVPIGPYQTPADLVGAIEKWGKTRTKSHQPVMMITDGWIKLEEVQQILENQTQEVRALFETDNVASTTMQRIGKEYAELKYLRRSAAAALAWPRTQHKRWVWAKSILTCFCMFNHKNGHSQWKSNIINEGYPFWLDPWPGLETLASSFRDSAISWTRV